MKNSKQNYMNEIASFAIFVSNNVENHPLNNFLNEMEQMTWLSHSDKWCKAYDFFAEHFPENTSLATGAAYFFD